MNNKYVHPGQVNEGSQTPYSNTLEAQQELNGYELENSRPAVEGVPSVPAATNLSPDFLEFSNTPTQIQQTQIQQQLYNLQERPLSSTYAKLSDLKDNLNSRKATLESQLKQVNEQLKQVSYQLDRCKGNL